MLVISFNTQLAEVPLTTEQDGKEEPATDIAVLCRTISGALADPFLFSLVICSQRFTLIIVSQHSPTYCQSCCMSFKDEGKVLRGFLDEIKQVKPHRASQMPVRSHTYNYCSTQYSSPYSPQIWGNLQGRVLLLPAVWETTTADISIRSLRLLYQQITYKRHQ